MSNTTNRQKYLDFIKQREVYENRAQDRFRELFLVAVHPIICPFTDYDSEARKRFPNVMKFDEHTCIRLHELFHGNGSIYVDEIESEYISFHYNVGHYDDAGSDFFMDAVLAYGSDEEFNTYLNTIVEECKAFMQYLKDGEINDQKAKTEQDYQRYLELKAQFESITR